MKTRKRLTAMALAALMLTAMALTAGAADAGERSVFLPEGIELTAPAQAAEGYVLYENGHVLFSMEVPAEYEVLEPYENTMLVSAEDPTDFQVHAEYAFATADNAHFLYDAQDFADLIEADQKQLTDWLGTGDIEVLGTGWGEVQRKRCFVCAFTMNGGDSSGALYVFDGQGDFGCYCVTAVINEKSDNATLYGQQLQHMIETFTVTGPCQMEGYTLYEREEDGLPVQFFVKDAVRVDDDADIYPVDGIYSEANIHIYHSGWDAGYDPERVLKGAVSLYIDDRGGHYVTQSSHFDLGRYSYYMAEVAYEQYDEQFTTRSAIFLSGGYWWEVYCSYTAEYADAVNDAFSDVLFSLRADGDGAVPGTSSAPVPSAAAAPADTPAPAAVRPAAQTITGPNIVAQIVDDIKAQEGFGSSSGREPLACVTRTAGGAWLLLAVYEIGENAGGYDNWYVCADAWLIQNGGAALLGRNQLYQEVDGNGGSLGWAEKDGVTWMVMECNLWEGDRFNDYYVYLPVNEQAGAFGQAVCMEAHGALGEEDYGEYIIDGEYYSREDFDLARGGYSCPDPEMPMDIWKDHGNSSVADLDATVQLSPDALFE